MKSLKEALIKKHSAYPQKGFTKDDLMLGDIVITRDGHIMQFIYFKALRSLAFKYADEVTSGRHWLVFELDWYDDNLTHRDAKPDSHCWDIMKVYRYGLNLPIDIKKHEELKHKLDMWGPLWERK